MPRRPIPPTLLLIVCLLGPALVVAEPPRALPIDGEPFFAELARVSADGKIVFTTDGEQRELSLDELVVWGAPRDVSAGPQVLLADGGLLVADVLGTADDRLRLDSLTFGEVALPLDRVAGILFRPPAERQRRDRLHDRLRDGKPGVDRLLLENGDELAGTILGISDTAVSFDTAPAEIKVTLDKIIAIAFDPELISRARLNSPGEIVGLGDGSRIVAAGLQYGDDQTRLELTDGTTWSVSSVDARAAAKVVSLQPIGAGVTYLSDLPVAGYVHVPFFQLEWPYRLDRNVAGTRLRAGGAVYDKGIGMHSTSRLTFRLDRPYRRFQAELAVDDLTDGRGSVVFRVFSGREQVYESPVVRGGDPPLAMSVDVGDTRLLSLIVDYADRGDELDRANWLNARLIE